MPPPADRRLALEVEPTAQQRQALRHFERGRSLKIEACAGSGKTTTLAMLAARAPGRRGLYLAYNRSIKEEASRSFPPHVECRTAHSLAYGAVGYRYKARLDGRLMPEQVTRALGMQMCPVEGLDLNWAGVRLLEAIQRFCNSADPAPGAKHLRGLGPLEEPTRREAVRWLEAKLPRLWALLSQVDQDLPISHDVYLKLWSLSAPRCKHDFVLLGAVVKNGHWT